MLTLIVFDDQVHSGYIEIAPECPTRRREVVEVSVRCKPFAQPSHQVAFRMNFRHHKPIERMIDGDLIKSILENPLQCLLLLDHTKAYSIFSPDFVPGRGIRLPRRLLSRYLS
jgi:hypothetical protein